MNREVSALETGNWRNKGIRDKKRNEGHSVIYGNNRGKTHNWGKSIDTLLWKPAENGPSCHCCLQGPGEGRSAVDACYPLPPKQLNCLGYF